MKKPGDLLKFPLLRTGHHAYCQWLPDGTVRVFLHACKKDLAPEAIVALPFAFRVVLFRDTPNRYSWQKVGKAEVPPEYAKPLHYARKDIITGEISIYYRGKERRATLNEVKGLETLAVWAHPHVVERLEAQLKGQVSGILKRISVNL